MPTTCWLLQRGATMATMTAQRAGCLAATGACRCVGQKQQQQQQLKGVCACTCCCCHTLRPDTRHLPACSVQVLEDNAFERSHHQRQRQQQQTAHAGSTDAAPMEVEADAGGGGMQAPVQPEQQLEQEQSEGQEGGAKRIKPRGGVWVPPHRRPDHE
jgi:hypothetical protein